MMVPWYPQLGSMYNIPNLLNPYWQILENSPRIFSRNFSFSGHEPDGLAQTVLRENSPGSLYYGLCIIFRLNALFWMRFPEIGLVQDPNICQ